MSGRLYRSRDDRMIAGVAGGLAERLDIDPSLVRIVWAILVLPSGFLALVVYVIAALVVPEEDDRDRSMTVGSWPASPGPPTWPGTAAGPPATWGTTAPAGPAAPASPPAPPQASMGAVAPGPPPLDPNMSRRDLRRAARAARHGDRAPGSASLVVGGGLIVLGTWFLVREYLPALDASRFWPVALVGLGILLVILAAGRRSDGTHGGR